MTTQHPTIDWSQVDWSKPNRDLQEELGVSRTTVIKHRGATGSPSGRAPHRPRLDPPLGFEWRGSLSATARFCGVSDDTVRRWMIERGEGHLVKKYMVAAPKPVPADFDTTRSVNASARHHGVSYTLARHWWYEATGKQNPCR